MLFCGKPLPYVSMACCTRPSAFLPLRYINRHGKRLSASGLNVLHNCVETILAPRSQNDRCSQFCKMASGTLAETAVCPCDDNNFSFNVPTHGYLLIAARRRGLPIICLFGAGCFLRKGDE